LLPQVKQLTDGLLAAMEHITDPQTLNGTLHAVRTLASHHLLPVVNQLLDRPLPHSTHTVRALQGLCFITVHHIPSNANDCTCYCIFFA
jgi:hypothetical protein